ncbi:MAG: hypothetical protein ACLRFL_02410 [Clostridia bacterium]
MVTDLRIEDDCLIFSGKRGYYNISLDTIDMFSKHFAKKMQIMTSNGRIFVDTVDDEEYIKIRDLLLTDSRFLMIDDYVIINLDNLNTWKVGHSRMDLYNLDLKFFHTLGVIGSKEECEHMKSMIDNAMKSRIEEYQASTTMHDTSVESNL